MRQNGKRENCRISREVVTDSKCSSDCVLLSVPPPDGAPPTSHPASSRKRRDSSSSESSCSEEELSVRKPLLEPQVLA